MSSENGTENSTVVNRVEGQTEPTRAPRTKKPKGRGARLWALSVRLQTKKAAMGGVIPTEDLGDIKVTVKGFPTTITDEEYCKAAATKGLTTTYDHDGKSVSGVELKKATDKYVGEAALEYLALVAKTQDKDTDTDD